MTGRLLTHERTSHLPGSKSRELFVTRPLDSAPAKDDDFARLLLRGRIFARPGGHFFFFSFTFDDRTAADNYHAQLDRYDASHARKICVYTRGIRWNAEGNFSGFFFSWWMIKLRNSLQSRCNLLASSADHALFHLHEITGTFHSIITTMSYVQVQEVW